ncbi:hypothetical protein BGZ73_007845 [Actinomortierella ambigua]|nr:hypothetical protein BGZ73_007845 [Actinomortierella ambigua]
MFSQSSQPMRLAHPTPYHLQQQLQRQNSLQQQQQQQPTQSLPFSTAATSMPMPMPMPFPNHHHQNNTGTPNNSFAGTIDPNLLQVTMGRMGDMSHLQNVSSLFPASTTPSSAGSTLAQTTHPLLGRSSLSNPSIKQEAASPDYLASELDFGEPGSMLSPGSSSPINSPLNDFDGSDDFSLPLGAGSGNGNGSSKPTPLNIHQGSYGESPNTGSLYSPGESDLFPDDITMPTSRPVDMKYGRNSLQIQSSLQSPFHSMSMPVHRSDWFGNTADGHAVGSYENPSGIQFVNSLFDDETEKTNARAMILNEKRRRRRESHNAGQWGWLGELVRSIEEDFVLRCQRNRSDTDIIRIDPSMFQTVERRRRDNINEKIQELSTLLPETYIDTANKPNKGVILRKSVDYIRHLQQLVASQTSRNQELEAQLRIVNGSGGVQESNINGNGPGSTHTNGGVDGLGMGGTPSSDVGASAQLHQGFGMMRIVGNEGNTPTNM